MCDFTSVTLSVGFTFHIFKAWAFHIIGLYLIVKIQEVCSITEAVHTGTVKLEACVYQERPLSSFPLSSDCPFGTFGMECKQICSCQSGICDRVTGKCLKFPFFQHSVTKATSQRFASHTGKNWFPGKHWNNSLIFSLNKKNYGWVEQDGGLNDFVSFILLTGKVGGCWSLLQFYKETSLIIFRLYNFSQSLPSV